MIHRVPDRAVGRMFFGEHGAVEWVVRYEHGLVRGGLMFLAPRLSS